MLIARTPFANAANPVDATTKAIMPANASCHARKTLACQASSTVITLATFLVLGSIAKATDFYRSVGLQLYDQQFMFPMIGAAFLLTFVHLTPRKGPRDHAVPWYDWILGLSGLFACSYLAWEYPRLADIVVK